MRLFKAIIIDQKTYRQTHEVKEYANLIIADNITYAVQVMNSKLDKDHKIKEVVEIEGFRHIACSDTTISKLTELNMLGWDGD